MSGKIRVMVVDDLRETRMSVYKMLQFDDRVEVVGEAERGKQAIEMASSLKPDVILMDINMPDMDGITATKAILEKVATVQIVMMSVQTDVPYMRQAMLAGARDFLMKPFSMDDLSRAVHEAYDRRARPGSRRASSTGVSGVLQASGVGVGSSNAGISSKEGTIIAIYSPKGGTGCTTIAINLGVSMARQGQRVLLIDANLQFGTVAVMLNMKPTVTLLDLINRVDDLDPDYIRSVPLTHSSSLQMLPAPLKPEMAELVKPKQMEKLLKAVRMVYDFVLVDTATGLDDTILAVLDQSERILLVGEPNLPTLKTLRDFLDLTRSLSYSTGKVLLTINRVLDKVQIPPKEMAKVLRHPVTFTIPLDVEAATEAANKGRPLVVGPERKTALAIALRDISERLVFEQQAQSAATAPARAAKKRGFLGRLFGR